MYIYQNNSSLLTNYTPSIYADGYIVFGFLFVLLYVHLFVQFLTVLWNLHQSFALKIS